MHPLSAVTCDFDILPPVVMSNSKRRRIMADSSEGNELLSDHESAGEAVQPVKSQAEQSRSLFIRSLPISATTESLTSLFSESYPLKHATVVVDPVTKLSKGYGFVTFVDAEDVQNAKEAFDGSLVDGSKIKVELARPRTRQGQGPERTGSLEDSTAPTARPSAEDNRKPPRLIVRNLPWKIQNADQLSLLFRSFGKVKQASVPKRGPGLSAGFGFVLLRGHKNAEKAMKALNGKSIDGRTIAVDWAVDKDTWTSLQAESQQDDENETQRNLSSEGTQDQAKSADDSRDTSGLLDSDEVEQNAFAHDPMEDDMGEQEDQEEQDIEEMGEKKNDDDDDDDDDDDERDESEIRDDNDNLAEDKSSTLFIRNLPFTATDDILSEHFKRFGSVRYARIVIDQTTERSRGVGFVCFYDKEDVDVCLRAAPKIVSTVNQQTKGPITAAGRHSLLQDISVDRSGNYTLEGRVLQVSRAVDRREAARLTTTSRNLREERDKDKRRLYLLGEGSVSESSKLYQQLSQTEIKMREDSLKQRKSLIRTNPALHLSLTRLSVRNLPRNIDSKSLKALAREAAVGFAKDVKGGSREQLTKEELSRGGSEMKEAERARKVKGKGIVKQAKVVFEGREGSKVAEDSGAGRSRGYGFIEYSSHRWALMGLRWLNGHATASPADSSRFPNKERQKRLIVEFAIENAQVVMRRQVREVKARETSKLSQKKMEDGALSSTAERTSKGSVTATNRSKGTKRKKDDAGDKIESLTRLADSKLANRQKIIGRKRMLRRIKRKQG